MEIKSQMIAKTAILTGITSITILALLEISGTIAALIHMWRTPKVSKKTTILLTPVFILVPYIDLIYLGYFGIKKLKKDSTSYKIVKYLKNYF